MSLCKIENIVLYNSNKRSMDKIAELLDDDYIFNATKALLDLDKGTVFILTGFFVNNSAETDGPVGAYLLGNVLSQIGYRVIIVTDKYCYKYFECRIMGSLSTHIISTNHIQAKKEIECLVNEFKPDSIISIERCGMNSSGDYCNMRGKSIIQYTAPLDYLLDIVDDEVLTIGIGDGGNEIGMGNVKDYIDKHIEKLSPCITETDYLIVSTVSNWGAYAMIGYLSILYKYKYLPDFDVIVEYINYINDLGAVDGVLGRVSPTVDGYDLSVIKNIYTKINSYCNTLIDIMDN